MPNPLMTLAKPVAFGARQAFNVTHYAVRAGAAAFGALRGGGDGAPPSQGEAEAEPSQPPPPQRRSSSQPKALDDVSITRKVESLIFRDQRVPKGKIDVNTADGVVWLRGEAKTPEMIKSLEREAAAVPEVIRVENLLHLPKTPASTRTDTPAAQRKTRRSSSAQNARKVTPRRVSSERHMRSPEAEPTPKELADQERGRQPAPLGSQEPTGDNGKPD
ncbi:MAG: hypothetical protein NVSMB25_13730 [Thermoleophilaceae bacterium]